MYVDWIGSSEPLVIGLHGMPTTPETLRPVLPVTSHRCGIVHLPGYGQSPPLDGAYDFAAIDLAIAQAVSTRPVVLVGMSGGAYRAIRLALGGVLNIKGLVLLGPTAGVRGGEKDALLGFANALRAGVDVSAAVRERFMNAEERCRPEASEVVQRQLPVPVPRQLFLPVGTRVMDPDGDLAGAGFRRTDRSPCW